MTATSETSGAIPVLTSVAPMRWTSSVLGMVAEGAYRRRPSEIARVVIAIVVVSLTAAGASTLSSLEKDVFDIIQDLPGWLEPVFEAVYGAGTALAIGLLFTALAARRWRLLLTLLVSGLLTWLIASALAGAIDLADALSDAGAQLHGASPQFPVVRLAASAAVVLGARPHLTRPARRLLEAMFWLMGLSAAYLGDGLPGAVLASLVLAWGVAALAHLAFGSPGGVPAIGQVTSSLRDLGIDVDDLRLEPEQSWGHTTFVAGASGDLSIDVVGRDSTDARFFANVWRFLWYKDSGSKLSLRRAEQVEHQAFVLLLAERSGARLPDLIAVGRAGARDDALLVARNPLGRALATLDPSEIDDALLDDAWANLGRLHRAQVAHGEASAANVVVTDDHTTGLVDLGRAETAAGVERTRLDDVHLLVTTAALVGTEQALGAAERAVGRDAIADLLPLFEPAALTSRTRGQIEGLKQILGDLREQGTAVTGTEVPEPAELRRFSLGSIFLAAACAFGVYLLVGELAGVAAMGDIFAGAEWGWVAATFVIAQVPQFCLAMAMLGAVSVPLAYGPVLGVQFANAFTGLVAGTAGNATLVIRFFQKQGLPATVAVSSGVLNSLAGFTVEAFIVVVGLLLTGSSFDIDTSGDSVPSWVVGLLAIVVLAVPVALLIPRMRARLHDVVEPQLAAAYQNVRDVMARPKKAVQLFGGNFLSQMFFALTLDAALHAYGESLPVLECAVINSFASFIGGMLPVPGGLGVVEAGMIAGFTAAGIPQTEAVAATFTARMFTCYLPPIWGWFILQSLRRRDYV